MNNNQKASQDSDIPVKIIKNNLDIFKKTLYARNSIELIRIQSLMKAANITPGFKKEDETDNANYRPISILPNLLKVLGRCFYNQLYKDAYNYILSLIKYFLFSNTDFEMVSVLYIILSG